MDIKLYNEKLSQLGKEFVRKKTELMKEFVDANNPYKVGDKVTDHIGTIVIEKIKYDWNSLGSKGPCAVYFGLELKKDGTPNKK